MCVNMYELLLHLLHTQVEELFLQFARKASGFNTVLSNVEEDLADPVRCNTLDEIKVESCCLV